MEQNAQVFQVNDRVSHPKYGAGVVSKIDHTDREFHYLCRFEDGTVIWLPDGEYKSNHMVFAEESASA